MIHEDIRYKVTFGSGKSTNMIGRYLKQALRDGNCNIASWKKVQ